MNPANSFKHKVLPTNLCFIFFVFALVLGLMAADLALSPAGPKSAFASALDLSGPALWTADGSGMATSDGPQAIFTNPAALGLRPGGGLFFGGTIECGKQRYSAVAVRVGELAFGFNRSEARPLEPEARSYVLGTGIPLGRMARLGVFGHWRELKDAPPDCEDCGTEALRDLSSFSYGAALMFRPCRHFSLGTKLGNINEPSLGQTVLSRFYEVGVGVRPLGNRVTFTADTEFEEGTELGDLAFRYGVELEPVDGLLLHAGYADRDGKTDFRFTVGFSVPHTSVGYTGESRDEGEERSGYYVSYTKELQRSLVKPGSKVIKLDVQGNLRDQASEGFFTLGGKEKSALPLLEELKAARKEEWVKGILLNIRSVSNMAVLQEMRSEIKRARAGGKKVVAFMDGQADFSEYYLASAADKIVIPYAGEVGPLGIGLTALLYKNFLAKLGIEFERFPCRDCEYKSAYASYTEEKFPEGYKEQINEILDDIYNEWLTDISKDRGIELSKLKDLADGRLMLPTTGKEEGLIDEIGFYDFADSLVTEMAGAPVDERLELRTVSHKRYDWGVPKRVAVVFAMGAILDGKNRTDFMEGNVMGNETMTKILSKVEKDKSVKAVVWRIDSPGGSGYASDVIWHGLEKLKKKKPLVSSMGMVAGSGGYWIAMNSDKIVADPLSFTGSIGVTGLKPVLAGTYDKLGINRETFKRGEHTDMFSTARHMTEDEMNMILDYVDQFYVYFVEKVAEGRGMTEEEVRKIGGGHVYTGRRALSIGLVDQLGGLEEAIQEAKKMAGIEGEVEVVYYHRPRKSLFATLTGLGAKQEPYSLSSLVGNTDGPMLIMDELPEVIEVEP
jgi:protease-4